MKVVWPFAVVLFALLVFTGFLSTLPNAEQKSWECHPYPGYCDIDTDWRPPSVTTNPEKK